MVTDVETPAKIIGHHVAVDHFVYLRQRPPGAGQGLSAYPFANTAVMLVAIAQVSGDRFVSIWDTKFLGAFVGHGQ